MSKIKTVLVDDEERALSRMRVLLSKFEEIEIATKYQYEGQESDQLPYDLCDVDIDPVYKKYKGWQKSLEGITKYDDLPETAKAYVAALEENLGTPITMISTGPEREKLILR